MYDDWRRGCIVSSWEAARLELFPFVFRDRELMSFFLLKDNIVRIGVLMLLAAFSVWICNLMAGRFLRMFLGPINVRASRKDVQLKVKEEYNSYRVWISITFCTVQSLIFPLIACDTLQFDENFQYLGLRHTSNSPKLVLCY